MRDRLIELIEQHGDKRLAKHIPMTSEGLADYLLANGVIVPPCKVGDKVWFIEKGGYHFPRISHGYVQHFDVREMRGLGLTRNIVVQPIDTLEDRLYFFMFKWVGDSFFLTREEAKRALKNATDNNVGDKGGEGDGEN